MSVYLTYKTDNTNSHELVTVSNRETNILNLIKGIICIRSKIETTSILGYSSKNTHQRGKIVADLRY